MSTITDKVNRRALLAYTDFSMALGDLVNQHSHLPLAVLHHTLLQKAYEVAACAGLPLEWRPPEPAPNQSGEAR